MKKHFREEDEQLYPDKKYKGILYDSSPSPPDSDKDDIPVKRAARKPKVQDETHAYTSKRLQIPDKPSPRKRGTVKATSPSRRSPRQQIVRNPGTSSSYSRDAVKTDRFVRNTMIACIIVAIVSVIAIPTSFAKPTTNITVNDGGRILEASTAALTVGEFMADNHITLDAEDILEASTDTEIYEGMEILIRRAMPVTLHSGDQSVTINMVTGTVQEALDKAGIVPAEHDEVYPSPDTYIRSGMKIEHIVVEVQNRTEYREIPFEKTTKEDKELAKGKTEIAQDGENGETELIFEQIYKNGMMTSEELISEVVTREPVTEVTAVGTYVPPPPKKTVKISDIKKGSSSGGSGGQVSGPVTLDDGVQAKYSVSLRVTAYCSACNGGTRTASGAYASHGTIAASTSQFPFGTKLFVPGYGYGVVQDTGGFSAGTIDVYIGERESCNCGSEWSTGTKTVHVIG